MVSDQHSRRQKGKVWTLIMEGHCLTVFETTDEVEISIGSTDSILNDDLEIHRVAAKFVPKQLSTEQRQLCVEVSEDMLQCTKSDPEFLKTVGH